MTDSMHEAFKELVFGYEGLEPEERLRADAHLSAYPSCRALLDALRYLEGGLGAYGCSQLAEEHPLLRLSPSEHREERESLSVLRRRLRACRLQLFSPSTRSSPRVDAAVQDPKRPCPGKREPEDR